MAANLDYHMRAWTYAGVSYTLMCNSSDYEPPAAQDPGRVNYFKQLVFAQARRHLLDYVMFDAVAASARGPRLGARGRY